MVRYPKLIGRYDTVSHKRDSGNGDNPQRFSLIKTSRARQDMEGLSTTTYKVTEDVETQLFTRIKVFINMTQILQVRFLVVTVNVYVATLSLTLSWMLLDCIRYGPSQEDEAHSGGNTRCPMG
ncbi:beta-1,4-galactosyltransferase 3 [Elysia marginata]|uniref:Beta-1,4-galactosyltransferase 3 n=1 Tax=Elysia marginata TaxID=1093978 RepID=A0AAV4J7B3_9GAST|nr:beta-1,4-galactosyltransferase 3 [Elysia marginata]